MTPTCRPHETAMEALKRLYTRMDRAYDAAAGAHGFDCRGCEDNCCYTRFYHHTLAEYLYIKAGVDQQPPEVQQRIRRLAEAAVQQMADADRSGKPFRVMCPLNDNGRCLLYAHRPMICRLHGIPHRLRRPDGRTQEGPGCDDFDRQCGRPGPPVLDRTPLYQALAQIERELRRQTGFNQKLKLTIAEMIITDLGLEVP